MRRDPSYCASDGDPPFAGRLEGDFLDQLRREPVADLNARIATLTAQERVILDFIVRGFCNKDICKALAIEITTAKAHTSRIFKKLGVKNRVQAAVLRLWAILLSTEHANSVTEKQRPPPREQASRSRALTRMPGVLQRETSL